MQIPPCTAIIQASGNIFACIKSSGSFMPPSYLPHSCWNLLRYRSDMWEQKSPATRNIARVYCRHACEVRRRFVLICRSSVAGSSGGCVAGTSAAYENQALNSHIHLFIYQPALPLTSLSLTIVVHHNNRCHPIRSRNEMLKCKPGYSRNRALEDTSLQGGCQDGHKEGGQ